MSYSNEYPTAAYPSSSGHFALAPQQGGDTAGVRDIAVEPTAITANIRIAVGRRDRHRCVVCWEPGTALEVAHVVAKTKRANYQMFWIWGRFLGNTVSQKILSRCLKHHKSYDDQEWILVPVLSDIQALINHEEADFVRRQREAAHGRFLPRTFPTGLSGGIFEYLYLHSGRADNARIGNLRWKITSPAPLGVDNGQGLPQRLLYTAMAPGEDVYPFASISDDGRILFDFRNRGIDIFAVICNALAALNGAFMPPIVFLHASLEGLVHYLQGDNNIGTYESLLVRLRNLYNREIEGFPQQSVPPAAAAAIKAILNPQLMALPAQQILPVLQLPFGHTVARYPNPPPPAGQHYGSAPVGPDQQPILYSLPYDQSRMPGGRNVGSSSTSRSSAGQASGSRAPA